MCRKRCSEQKSGQDRSDIVCFLFGNLQGDISFSINVPGTITTGARTITIDQTTKIKTDVTGYLFTGTLRYPLTEKLNVVGKLGGYWTTDQSLNLTSEATTVFTSAPVINLPPSNAVQFSDQFEDDDSSLVFGIGAEYRFNDRINIRAEWKRYKDSGFGIKNADLFSLGASYSFDVK